MKSLLSNMKRLIVKQISFTARCSGMADLYIYIYIYIYRERERERERETNAHRDTKADEPPSIEYRCLAYQYTKSVLLQDLVQCTYIYSSQMYPPVYQA